jgi:hypothetical protein
VSSVTSLVKRLVGASRSGEPLVNGLLLYTVYYALLFFSSERIKVVFPKSEIIFMSGFVKKVAQVFCIE